MDETPPLFNGLVAPKPFIRWAGGKTWLQTRLQNLLPVTYNNYHEPFLGGGATFFSIAPPNTSFLSDLNEDLINAYQQLKEERTKVIEHIKSFKNTESYYYRLRNDERSDRVFEAARFIFLNRTCYNGIYRVNRSGKFNVPYGHDANAPIFTESNLKNVENALKTAYLSCEDFYVALNHIEKNDFVFLDPPYTVAHSNNGFISYNQKLFTWDDQERLAEMVAEISRRGAKFVLTNAVHESIRELYRGIGKQFEIPRFSTITSQIGKRREISEYLITNVV